MCWSFVQMVLVENIVLHVRKHHLSCALSKNVYDSILARLRVEVLRKSFAFSPILLHFPSHPVFSPHVFVKKNVFVCFDFVFRGGLQNLFVLMNGKTVDSLYLMGYFYITSIIFPIHLVYGRFACTTNSWCTHDVSMTYFYYAFKLYDGEHKRLAVNERVTKRTSEISLRYSCKSSCTVILRFLSEAQLQRTFSDLTRKF